jgi:hypothetical protein
MIVNFKWFVDDYEANLGALSDSPMSASFYK